MKRIIAYILPLLLFCACSDSDSDMPVIKVVGLFIEGDEEEINYANSYIRMPLLEKGDKVEIHLKLEGNGEDLGTFAVRSIKDDIEKVQTEIIDFKEDETSPDLSKPEEGNLVFVDGVDFSSVKIQATILADEEGEQTISFYLFSKAIDSEGARLDLILKTQLKHQEYY